MRYLLAISLIACSLGSLSASEDIEFFEKKVRPLLVAQCIKCHGPEKQKGGLRLDSRAAAMTGGDTGPVLVPSKPEESLLIQVVDYKNDTKMPPSKKLADEEIAILTDWIKKGAAWPDGGPATAVAAKGMDLKELAKHWSFQQRVKPTPPQNDENPIDAFLLKALKAKGLSMNPATDRRVLIRRLTYDLTGLPPTPQEIEAFLKDNSPNAYDTLVSRLLASSRYGERWARHWLDLVRYSETMGHEFDFEFHEPWRYRDYVVRAFNADLPYDQFVREHLAGDSMTTPRRHPQEKWNESILATAFWFFGEAKHSPVDVRLDQADRIDNQIDVFAKTFLGLTVACARCHDHKFDPIPTKDYYALYGIIASSRHDRTFIDSPEVRRPLLDPIYASVRKLDELAISRTSRRLEVLTLNSIAPLSHGSSEWNEMTELVSSKNFPESKSRLKAQYKQRETSLNQWEERAKPLYLRDGWTTTGEAFGLGSPRAVIDGDQVTRVPSSDLAHGYRVPKLQGTLRSPTFMIDRNFMVYRVPGKNVRVNLIIDNYQLIQDPIYGGLRFNASDKEAWLVQNVERWKGQRAYIELLDDGDGTAGLVAAMQSDVPDGPRTSINPLLASALEAKSPQEVDQQLRRELREANSLWLQSKPLSIEQAALLTAALSSTALATAATDEEKRLRSEVDRLAGTLPAPRRAMTMIEGTGLNERVFIRGNPKSLGEEVPRRFLEVLHGKIPTQGTGRLELAEQLVDPSNPLTSRVIVNRIWKHHFGTGLVASPDDFGHQGQVPSNKELLDWLANWFIENGWSIKKLHQLIVTSKAYRQSSDLVPAATESDPKNELLHRMPVRRLEAEAIRDSILAVSGRLDEKKEGPSVATHLTPFMAGRGRPGGSGPLDGDGRRSIYLQVRRNFLNPMFLAFDYPIPFSTMGRRSVSNVPAQALSMLNNPFVLQQAEVWAKRVLAEPGRSDEQRITTMYETAFGRPPSKEELADAVDFLKAQTQEYKAAGDPRPWIDLAHVLFNVKEFIFVK